MTGAIPTGLVFRGTLGDETQGTDGWRAYGSRVRAGSSDFHDDVVELIAIGDRAAARLLYTGTHDGPLLGIPATGRPFRYAGAAFFTAAGGRLTSAWVLGDLTALVTQLGTDGADDRFGKTIDTG